jgi:hypothetical protein
MKFGIETKQGTPVATKLVISLSLFHCVGHFPLKVTFRVCAAVVSHWNNIKFMKECMFRRGTSTEGARVRTGHTQHRGTAALRNI